MEAVGSGVQIVGPKGWRMLDPPRGSTYTSYPTRDAFVCSYQAGEYKEWFFPFLRSGQNDALEVVGRFLV